MKIATATASSALMGRALPRRLRLLIILVVVEVYVASFIPLYNLAGFSALNVFCLVAAVAGGLLGVRGGLFVALVGLLLHALPFGVLTQVAPGIVSPAAAGTYALAVIAMATGFGLMQDWRERLRLEETHLTPPDLRSVASKLPVVLFTLDREGKFTMSEGRGLARIGRRPGEAVGHSIFQRWAGLTEVHDNVRRALAGETVAAATHVGAATFDVTYAPLRSAAGAVEGVIGLGLDVTEHEAEREVEDAGQRDALTGLPNRAGLIRRLDEAVAHSRRNTALLVLDLDRFRDVNDGLGHTAGDELLKTVAERVFALTGVKQHCGRLGGDEFAIVAPDTDERGAAVLARTLSDALRAPISLAGQETFINVSIGIAVAPRDGVDSTSLLRGAEVAMYSAKRSGTAWAIYAPGPDDPSAELLALATDLRHAIEQDQIALAFQPIVEAATGRVSGFEVLARWHRKDGPVPPMEFVALAERVGLLTALTDRVVAGAVRQLRTWLLAGLDARVTVNLSPRNLLEPDLPRRVASALQAAGVPAERFGIEVTENTLMTDPDRAARTIAELRELGIPIAIDDFGTGYSSLAYLHRLPISAVKIDKSFMRDVATAESGRAIVRATVDLAHALDFTVVAEGVEDEQTLRVVRDLGCDLVQGFHVGHPIPAAEATRLLRA